MVNNDSAFIKLLYVQRFKAVVVFYIQYVAE